MLQRSWALALAMIVGTSCASAPVVRGRSIQQRWENVMAVQPGASVEVQLTDRSWRRGQLASATSEAVRVRTSQGDVTVPRDQVARVVQLLRHTLSAEEIAKRSLTGAVKGALIFRGAGEWLSPGDGVAVAAVAGAAGAAAAAASERRVSVYEVAIAHGSPIANREIADRR